jgi:hypothetical protein
VDVASLSLRVDTSDLTDAQRELRRLGNQGGQTEGQVTRFGGAAQRSFGVVAAAATAALISVVSLGAGFNKFVANTITADSAQAQLAAAIASTGGAADRTLEQLNQHAAALQKITNVGDEATNAMQGVLLTFTQIQGSVFDRATAAVLDLSTAMGTGLNAAALQVGKALNDPVLGMTALSRSGIQFTQAQKDVVAAMVETNNVAGAQAIILDELEKQFGGSAAAARGTLGGALESLGNAFGDLFEIANEGSDSLRTAVESLIDTVSDPSFVAAIQGIGVAMFGMAQVAIKALSAISSAFTLAAENVKTLGVVIAAIVATQIPAAVAAFIAYTAGVGAAGLATGALTAAVTLARAALIALGGPIGIISGLLGAVAAAYILFNDNVDTGTEASTRAQEAMGLLNETIDTFSQIESPAAQSAALGNAMAYREQAAAALEVARAELLKIQAMNESAEQRLAEGGGVMPFGTKLGQESANASAEVVDELTFALNMADFRIKSLATTIMNQQVPAVVKAAKVTDEATDIIKKSSGAVDDLTESLDDGATSADGFADTFRDGITSAFDYVLGGMKNGMDGLLDIFKRTLLDMIKYAIMNPINLQGGMSIAGMGSAALSGGGGMLGGLGAGLGTIGAGLTSGASVAINGIMAGGGLGPTLGAVTGGIGAGGLSGFATAIGAAAVPLLAVAAVFSFFKSKTKLIDSGIQATIDMEEAMFESFREIEKSRFFGLSKKRSTSTSALSAEEAGPLNEAVFLVRESVIGAAESLGVSSDIFDGFTHKFTLSLKGLDEAAQAAAITEEFARMGDSLAGLVPHIATMNQLFAVAVNRVSLTDRLLQAQGETEELTARIRAREMDATNELNKALLAQVFAAEDAAAAINRLTASFSENAFATGVDFRRGMARASNGIEYSPQQSQAEMLAELKGLNARMDLLQSTSEITANSSSQTAENTDYSNALALDAQT